jgi:YhcH/YjgK/YiaL family protein
MIVDRITNAGLYSADKKLAKALAYLAKTDFAKVEPGKYELDGAKLFALVQQVETKAKEEKQFEAHRKYIDVQFIVSGAEQMGYTHISTLKTSQAYDADKDCEMLRGAGDFITATAGTFVVFFPEDAHMPCVAMGKPAAVKKVVVKVAV